MNRMRSGNHSTNCSCLGANLARGLWLAILVAALPLLAGCSVFQPRNWRTLPDMLNVFGPTGGEITVKSIKEEGTSLTGGFENGSYTLVDQNTATMILLDGPVETATQAVTIRMFWNPNAGRTPIDPTATNATIQYVIFTGENQIGIYSGAGYMYPHNDVGGDKFVASMWQSSIRIADKTDAFYDRLGQARLEGKFAAQRDDLGFDQVLHKLNARVRERLGRARLVDAPNPQSIQTASRER